MGGNAPGRGGLGPGKRSRASSGQQQHTVRARKRPRMDGGPRSHRDIEANEDGGGREDAGGNSRGGPSRSRADFNLTPGSALSTVRSMRAMPIMEQLTLLQTLDTYSRRGSNTGAVAITPPGRTAILMLTSFGGSFRMLLHTTREAQRKREALRLLRRSDPSLNRQAMVALGQPELVDFLGELTKSARLATRLVQAVHRAQQEATDALATLQSP